MFSGETDYADYAHHSTMGLVWLKFSVAALELGAAELSLSKTMSIQNRARLNYSSQK